MDLLLFGIYKETTDELTNNNILDNLIKTCNFPVYYFVGEYNRGTYISEKLIKNSDFILEFVPNSGHNVHIENSDYFWNRFTEIIEINKI